MKQTAVEWLVEQLEQQKFVTKSQIYIAKEIEKKQIIDANNRGYKSGRKDINETAEQYYNETFKQL